MIVEPEKIPPIHQRKFEIGLRPEAAWSLIVVMSESEINLPPGSAALETSTAAIPKFGMET